MLRARVIPTLLLKGRGFYKTVRFKNPVYVGDPVNTLRIFCEKQVDEVVVLDIGATKEGRGPQLDIIGNIASECFMPLAYGGGIRTRQDARAVLKLGVEKVILNTSAVENPKVISEIADLAGSSSVVVSIDAKKKLLGGYDAYTRGGTSKAGMDPVSLAQMAEALGAGEIMITAIDRDGTMEGYDIGLVEQVSHAVRIPVIAAGGAGSVEDLEAVITASADAAAAGSLFVFQGRHRAVLISYPTPQQMERLGRLHHASA